MPVLEDMPTQDAFVAPRERNHALVGRLPELLLTVQAIQWLGSISTLVQEAPSRQDYLFHREESSSIATTPLNVPSVTSGLWRVSFSVRVTQVATTSSSIQVTVSWTEGGISQSETGTALTGNTLTTREGRSMVIHPDEGTPISYSTTYASVGAQPMKYSLDIAVEELATEPQ